MSLAQQHESELALWFALDTQVTDMMEKLLHRELDVVDPIGQVLVLLTEISPLLFDLLNLDGSGHLELLCIHFGDLIPDIRLR